jgi:hypothetical protein
VTSGGRIRKAKAMLRALCAKNGHRWTGDKQRYCEVCSVKENKQ